MDATRLQRQSCVPFLRHLCAFVSILMLSGCQTPDCEPGIPPESEIRIVAEAELSPWDIECGKDGALIVTGNTGVVPPGDAFLAKLDASGAVLWKRILERHDTQEARGVAATADGGYIAAGYTGHPVYDLGLTQSPTELLIFKLDSSGDALWSRRIKVDKFTIGYSVCVNPDETFAVAGSTGATAPGDRGALLIKFDADGEEVWRQQYRKGLAFTPWDVIATSDNGYAIVGHIELDSSHPRRRDVYILKLDENGDIQWDFQGQDSIENEGYRVGRGIVETQDGGYAVVGSAREGDEGELFLAKLDSGGALAWNYSADGAQGYDLAEAPDGSIVAVGGHGALFSFTPCQRFYALRVSQDGAILWSGRFESDTDDIATAVTVDSDGNFVLAGFSESATLFRHRSLRLVITLAGSEGTAEAP